MRKEAWHRTIENQPATIRDANFCATPYKPIEGVNNARMRFLSVRGANQYNLDEGLYVETDVHPDEFFRSPDLAVCIGHQVSSELMGEPKRLPDELGYLSETTESIRFEKCDIAIDGGQIITFEPYLHNGFTPEIDDFVKGKSGGCNIPGADLECWNRKHKS